MMRAVAYTRVSTAGQADNTSPEEQRHAIHQWAQQHKATILETFHDTATGKNGPEDRPGLANALNTLRYTQADTLVAYRLDRLARQLTVQEAILAQAWKHDATVWTVEQGEIKQDDPSDPMRTAMRQMMGIFAQLERGMITARTQAGRKRKAESGGYAFGSPPFGYKSVEGRLEEIPDEQETVRRIVELHEEGQTLREIADTLNAEERPTKRPGAWHPSTVRRIIQRET